MFTGIITDVGEVRKLEKKGDMRVEINTRYLTSEIDLGASISCSGACLTVIEKGENWFAVEASAETFERTTIGEWGVGTKINTERALKLGEELGGHIVSGHVDGVAKITDDVSPGIVVATLGYWRQLNQSGTVNSISTAKLADMGNAPTFSDNLVEFSKLN